MVEMPDFIGRTMDNQGRGMYFTCPVIVRFSTLDTGVIKYASVTDRPAEFLPYTLLLPLVVHRLTSGHQSGTFEQIADYLFFIVPVDVSGLCLKVDDVLFHLGNIRVWHTPHAGRHQDK